jgi:hypothetical protein
MQQSLRGIAIVIALCGCASDDAPANESIEAAIEQPARSASATGGQAARASAGAGSTAELGEGGRSSMRPRMSAATPQSPPRRASCADACEAEAYCHFPSSANCGDDDPAAGVCMKRPSMCADEYAPVCGCNGVNYLNECDARTNGVSVRGPGAC